ncbi:hypothetical protein ACVWW6_005527 [Bradyrhizobium sp. USDA 3311]
MSGFSGIAYQAGLWTPVLQGATTPGTFTYSVQSGSYERIGRRVAARFNIQISAVAVAPVGLMTISGLPLVSANVANDLGIANISILKGVAMDAGYTWLGGYIVPNDTNIALFENASNSTTNAPAQIVGGNVTGSTITVVGMVDYRI